MNNPWKTIKKNIIYKNNFGYTVRDDDVITPAGKPGKFMVIEHDDFVVIVAVTPDKHIVSVRQWRYAREQECLELPAGSINEGEEILSAAKRELQEETGYSSDNWQELHSYYAGLNAMKIRGHIFLAKDAVLSSEPHNDETENIIVETHTYSELLDMIDQNVIANEHSILGLFFAKKFL
ncbi:MAG: NUDIX hydrolase [Microgenomates group bacterium]